MKVLILNTSDIHGGAARAAYRLHQSLLAQNVDSQMLVQDKRSDDFTVRSVNNTKIKKGFAILRPTLDALPLRHYKNKTKTLFSVAGLPFSGIVEGIKKINPDIVHLHWIAGGMLRLEDLLKIKAPIVWSLHDMWAFTGGCHYDEDCRSYEKRCGSCKVLNSTQAIDLSQKIFKRKQRIYSKIGDLTIVGVSQWFVNSAAQSLLLSSKNIINLPNPINTDMFKPLEKNKARALWNIPDNKKLVLFGAIGATSDPRKGFKELTEAIKKLDTSKLEFVVFGSSEPENAPDLGCKVHYVGQLSDDISLVTLYSAVDVMVVPSLQENLSNVIMESLSCATPVVSFNVGGNSDLVDHKINGYLAEPFDTSDLANGISWILNNKNYSKLCVNAREKVIAEFDSEVVALQYIDLYNSILK